MKAIKNIWALPLLLLGVLLSGCEKEFDNPAEYTPAVMTPTMTIAEFKALYTGNPLEIGAEIIIGGRVVSTDRYGNFYRSLFIEDETGGIEVKIGKTGLYNIYPRGMMLYVKPKGLCLGAYGGMVNLGATSTDPSYQNSWIDVQYWIDQTVFRGERGGLVAPEVVTSMEQLTANPKLLGSIVKFEGVTFVKGGLDTWAVPNDPNTSDDEAAYGEQKIKFGSNSTTVTIRTSGYAKFAASPVPANGSTLNVTGVLTKFNTTWQLLLNNTTDVVVQ